MALTNLALISAVLTKQFAPTVSDQINNNCVLLSQLDVKPGKGLAVDFSAKMDRAVKPAGFVEGSDVAEGEFQSSPKVPATLPWGRYRTGIKVSGLAESVAAGSDGSPAEIMDIVRSELSDAIEEVSAKINRDLWTGTGATTTILGLTGGGILAATGVYANIAQATYAEWAATVSANGGTLRLPTKALIDEMERQLFTKSGKADFMIASPDVIPLLETAAAVDPRLRIAANRGEISGARVTEILGDSGLSYRGVPIFRDHHAPAASLAFLNRKELHIKTLKQVYRGPSSGDTTTNMDGMAEGKKMGIHVEIQALGRNGDARRFQLVTTLQLVCTRRNAHGLISDLGTP